MPIAVGGVITAGRCFRVGMHKRQTTASTIPTTATVPTVAATTSGPEPSGASCLLSAGVGMVGEVEGDVVGSAVDGDVVGSEVVGETDGDVVGSSFVGEAVGVAVGTAVGGEHPPFSTPAQLLPWG